MAWNNIWSINFDDNYPIKEQIVQRFEHALVNREVQPGEKIPSIRELSLQMQVSTKTIQRAIEELEKRGVIENEIKGGRYKMSSNTDTVVMIKQRLVHDAMKQLYTELEKVGYTKHQMIEGFQNYLNEEEGAK